MKMLRIAAAAALIASPVVAQEASNAVGMDEIIVTGSRAIEWDPDDIPVIQLERRADNLIVAVRVVNDTRDAPGRRDEITRTLRAMARAAAGREDIDLSIEDDGTLVPLTEDMVSTLTLGMDPGRSDTSVASLVVKTPIREGDTLDAASERIEEFVEGVDPVGRSLADVVGDWQLSVVNPAQYRAPILAAIAADARTTAATFGDGYAVQVEGMSNRVTWRQSGPLELALFIPYDMTVTPTR
ncbi:hypothetical protein [Brevundimonas sp.]|uniref:hypothetical protein n=1 Tax=Brevundimonas sp. TaxID=1871086 RepID=UPI0027378A71|nr:hypothetical protein [Brevundimonas sp.]MDP3803608.1 hypothetical protein [Brevundimonas sp.]